MYLKGLLILNYFLSFSLIVEVDIFWDDRTREQVWQRDKTVLKNCGFRVALHSGIAYQQHFILILFWTKWQTQQLHIYSADKKTLPQVQAKDSSHFQAHGPEAWPEGISWTKSSTQRKRWFIHCYSWDLFIYLDSNMKSVWHRHHSGLMIEQKVGMKLSIYLKKFKPMKTEAD